MKNLKFISAAFCATLLFISCDNDDDTPDPVNEEEVITTLTAVMTPETGGDVITLQTRDLDGEGPNDPVVTVSGNFAAGTTYNGELTLLNETVDPADNITEEVEEEAEEHQFFYTVSDNLNITTMYSNFDANNNPLGTQFTLTTGGTSTGALTFTLRHEPSKPNTGLDDAGGETDIAALFNVVIE